MALCTFYPCKTDASSTVIETLELHSDDDAAGVALKVLLDHLSCAYVAVWQNDRPVLTKHRLRAGLCMDRE